MAGQVGTVGCNVVSLLEEVADALDDKIGYVLEAGTTAGELSVKLCSVSDNDHAIGICCGKLQDGTGSKEPVKVALIDSGGIARVRVDGAIAKNAGVTVSAANAGKVSTATIGTADIIGIALEASSADNDLIAVQLSRQTPA